MTSDVIEFNADELVPPEWLNVEFFTNVINESEHRSNIKVIELAITPGSGKGDHYASVIFRAKVDYVIDGKNKTKSLIIKTMPEQDGLKKDLFEETHMFETEIGMYTKVLPKFHEILKAAGDNTVLGGDCLYSSLHPRKFIIFEDLVPLGYTVIRDGLPTDVELKQIISKLAKWHAISYKLVHEMPEFLTDYRYGVMNKSSVFDACFLRNGIDYFIEMLDQTPTLREYKPHFEALKMNDLTKCKQSFTEYWDNRQAGVYYVLCHGDFHTKNLMFKRNVVTNECVDVMLLDFQFCYVGPIVNDLIYMKFMLLSNDARQNRWDEILYYYFMEFVNTLKKTNYMAELPKYAEFRRQFEQHRIFELLLMVNFLPVMHALADNTFEADKFMESAEYCKPFYGNEKFIAEMHKLLPWYLHSGYFEDLHC